MRCSVKRCRGEAEVIHLGRPLCEEHWQEHCKESDEVRE